MSIRSNPIIQTSKYKHGAVPFEEIKLEHFIPALDYAIEKADETFNAVKNNSENPTFENTILAMEHGSELMGHVAQIYFNLRGKNKALRTDKYRSRICKKIPKKPSRCRSVCSPALLS